MPDLEDPLSQLENALEELVLTASSLAQLVKEGALEEQIIPLQEKQEALVARVIQLDATLQLGCTEAVDQYNLRLARIQEKLTEFQAHNQEFIEQLRRSKNIILFDKENTLDADTKRLQKSLRKKR